MFHFIPFDFTSARDLPSVSKIFLRYYRQACCCQVLFSSFLEYGHCHCSSFVIFTQTPPFWSSNFTAKCFSPQAQGKHQGLCFIDVQQSTFALTSHTAIFPPIQIHTAPSSLIQPSPATEAKLHGSFLDHLPSHLLSTHAAKSRSSSVDCQALLKMQFWICCSRAGRVSLLLKSHVQLTCGMAHKSQLMTQAKKGLLSQNAAQPLHTDLQTQSFVPMQSVVSWKIHKWFWASPPPTKAAECLYRSRAASLGLRAASDSKAGK